MKARITNPFYYPKGVGKQQWFFGGDEVNGACARAAVEAGCAVELPSRKRKSLAGAPENKGDSADEA